MIVKAWKAATERAKAGKIKEADEGELVIVPVDW